MNCSRTPKAFIGAAHLLSIADKKHIYKMDREFPNMVNAAQPQYKLGTLLMQNRWLCSAD
jgi:hypothetical protein